MPLPPANLLTLAVLLTLVHRRAGTNSYLRKRMTETVPLAELIPRSVCAVVLLLAMTGRPDVLIGRNAPRGRTAAVVSAKVRAS